MHRLMADALFITGTIDYDGSDWYVEDPLYVKVTVEDPDGAALGNADVTVALVGKEDAVEATKTVKTDENGAASLSLTTSEVGVYEVIAGAKTSSRKGYAAIEDEFAAPKPPFAIQGVTKAGELDLDLTESNHSITTVLV